MEAKSDYPQLAQDIVESAVRAGAHEAEVYLQYGNEFDVDVRMGEIETLSQASFKGLGLRVFVDKRMSFASTTDFDAEVLDQLVKTTVQLAKAASKDDSNGLPEEEQGVPAHLDLVDPEVIAMPAETKISMARATERAALDYDPRITNSHGGGFSTHFGTRIIANSNGILYENSGTDCSVACGPMAEENNEKQIGHYWSCRRFLNQLDSPEEVGRQAAIRALRRLGGRKVETQKAPVVFDWTAAPGLLAAVFNALDGDSVHRGMSFLKDMIGKQVASDIVTVIDDPLMPNGLGSMPFDGEGVITRRKVVIEKGMLNMYFYDARTARKYGEKPTGNARRGFGSVPDVSPTNFYLKPTETDVSEIIAGISNGFYVMDTMGRGADTVTGDFSVGAQGLWIKDGEITFPVQEVTIAGNMLDMLRNIEQIGNDAKFMSSVVSPTLKIAEMTISGR